MGVRSNVVIVLASLCLFACGSAKNGGEAKGPETNPWADYKGTYATAGTPSEGRKAATQARVAKADEPTPAPTEEPAAVDEAPAAAPTPASAKKAKGGGGKAAAKKKK